MVVVIILPACNNSFNSKQDQSSQVNETLSLQSLSEADSISASTTSAELIPSQSGYPNLGNDDSDSASGKLVNTQSTDPSEYSTLGEGYPAQQPVKTQLEASDPSKVNLASGEIQLVEFFAFW